MAHIIAKRDAESGNGQEVAYELVNVLAKGTEIETQRVQNISGNDRIRIFYNNYTAVLSESPEGNRWLLTGWENKEETTTSANGEVRDSSKATTVTPTLTRRNRDVVVSKISISDPDEKINTKKSNDNSNDITPVNANISNETENNSVQVNKYKKKGLSQGSYDGNTPSLLNDSPFFTDIIDEKATTVNANISDETENYSVR